MSTCEAKISSYIFSDGLTVEHIAVEGSPFMGISPGGRQIQLRIGTLTMRSEPAEVSELSREDAASYASRYWHDGEYMPLRSCVRLTEDDLRLIAEVVNYYRACDQIAAPINQGTASLLDSRFALDAIEEAAAAEKWNEDAETIGDLMRRLQTAEKNGWAMPAEPIGVSNDAPAAELITQYCSGCGHQFFGRR